MNEPLTLVTYNLRLGGARRTHWTRVLDEFRPDIFLVQETANPHEHLPPFLHPGVAERVVWNKANGCPWGSAVYVRKGAVRPISLPDFPGLVVGVEVFGAGGPGGEQEPIRGFSIHAPRRGSYSKAVHAILNMIARLSGQAKLVIGGDFNLSVGVRHVSEDRKTSVADLAIQRRLDEEFGLVNCWGAANSDRPLAQTLRWSSDPTVSYHCDGLFVPRSWAPSLKTCEVISSPEWDGLSDHNPVVARFEGLLT